MTWIDAEKKKPPHGEVVLVYLPESEKDGQWGKWYEWLSQAWYCHETNHWHVAGHGGDWKVGHWMKMVPRPERVKP